MIVHSSDSSKTEYSNILSISSAYDTFTIFLLPPDRFYINSVTINVLTTVFSSSRSWLAHMTIVLAFLSYFLFSVYRSIFVRWLSCNIVPCQHTWLVCLLFFNASGGMISPLLSHEVAVDEVSVSLILRNWSRVIFLLNFGLASLLFLLNVGSDKRIKYLRSL